jgi:hypothetical protein
MFSFATARGGIALGIVVIGAALAASSVGIVRAERARPADNGVFRCTAGRACVEGDSHGHGTLGVFGVSPNDGVYGATTSVSGKAGVRGISQAETGVAYGVQGTSSNGAGVAGFSRGAHGAGVYGLSRKGEGVLAESAAADEVALRAHADTSRTGIFVGQNQANRAHCVIDQNANLSCTGNISSDATISSTHRNALGQRVVAYAPESTTATIEDVGTAHMSGGVAEVRIDPVFAAMFDRRGYYVFLTPLGDSRGLYVSSKLPSGFQVREDEHGRGNLAFDYRIVAHPLDASSDRLPMAPASR